MNPMTNMKNVLKLSDMDLKPGQKSSWHDQYKDSAWVFVGGLPYDLTEGDIICVFSQYGEIVNINLVRDKATGKQKGFCFICYEDQRSTILAVDNLNGISILNKKIRVDHCKNYKPPKADDKMDEETKLLQMEGCAPKLQIPVEKIKKESSESDIVGGVRLPQRLPIRKIEKEEEDIKTESTRKVKKEKKAKKDKKSKKSKKEKRSKKRGKSSSSCESKDSDSSTSDSESEYERKRKR